MKQFAVTAISILVLLGCGDDKSSGSANVTVTYERQNPPMTCVSGDCTPARWGRGDVHNTGGRDALNVRVRIKTTCEDYYQYATPRSLAPGQYGSYQTGLYGGCGTNVTVVWDEE